MDFIKEIEIKLGTIVAGLPGLANNTKDSLVALWPYLALIVAFAQLLASWALLGLSRVQTSYVQLTNQNTGQLELRRIGPGAFDKLAIFVAILFLVAEAAIMIVAYAPLKRRQLVGWRMAFLATLVNVAYAIVSVFITGRGVMSLIASLVFSAVGLYLLFQVQSKYHTPGKHPKTPDS